MQRPGRGRGLMKKPQQPQSIHQERRRVRGPLLPQKQVSSPISSTGSALSGDGAICPDDSGFVSFKLEDIKMVDFGCSEPVDDKAELRMGGDGSEEDDHVVVEDENGSPEGKSTSKWREAAKVLMREQEQRRETGCLSPTASEVEEEEDAQSDDSGRENKYAHHNTTYHRYGVAPATSPARGVRRPLAPSPRPLPHHPVVVHHAQPYVDPRQVEQEQRTHVGIGVGYDARLPGVQINRLLLPARSEQGGRGGGVGEKREVQPPCGGKGRLHKGAAGRGHRRVVALGLRRSSDDCQVKGAQASQDWREKTRKDGGYGGGQGTASPRGVGEDLLSMVALPPHSNARSPAHYVSASARERLRDSIPHTTDSPVRRLLQPRQPEYGASPRRHHSLQGGELYHEGDTPDEALKLPSHYHAAPTVYKPRLACYRNKTGLAPDTHQLGVVMMKRRRPIMIKTKKVPSPNFEARLSMVRQTYGHV